MWTYRAIASVLALGMLGGGCNTPLPLPAGASYIYPIAQGVAPAHLYSAQLVKMGDSISAYDLTPICANDFALASSLKGLTSHNTLKYGNISVTAGPQVMASLTGIPVNSFVTLGGGLGYSARETMNFSNVQLYQADDDDVAGTITTYLRNNSGKNCAALVRRQIAAGNMIIATTGVLLADQASVGPEQNGASACAPASASAPAGSASSAPISGCLQVGLGKGPSIAVKASDGTVDTQTITGGVIAILPSQISL